jgi:hypothetical protein
VIPDRKLLAQAYRHAVEGAVVAEAAEQAIEEAREEATKVVVSADRRTP